MFQVENCRSVGLGVFLIRVASRTLEVECCVPVEQ